MVFQEDCFELDHVALPTEIFISPRHQDPAHSNLLVFLTNKELEPLCIYLSIYF